MKAWSVGILTNCPDGLRVSSYFLLGESRAEVLASAVRSALQGHRPDCPAHIVGSVAYEIDPRVVQAAAEQLGAEGR